MCRGEGVDRGTGDLDDSVILHWMGRKKESHLSQESMGRCHGALLPAAARLLAQPGVRSCLSETCNLPSQLGHLRLLIIT